MVGGISLTDYAFRLDAINIRYDFLANDETELKDRYKRSKGYKIAHNWANVRSRYLAMNERNRRQAFYRLEQEYSLSFLEDVAAGNDAVFQAAGTLISGIFFAIGGSAVIEYIEKARSAGVKTVFGARIGDGDMRTYKDDMRIEMAVRKVIRACSKWQKKDESKYPTITFRFGKSKTSNAVYFTLTANK